MATTARAATERARHAAWKASARRRARHRGGGEGREGGRGTAHRTQGHGSPHGSRPGRAPMATAHGGGARLATRLPPTPDAHVGGSRRPWTRSRLAHPGRPRRAADRAPWTPAAKELGRGGGVAGRGGRRRGRGAAGCSGRRGSGAPKFWRRRAPIQRGRAGDWGFLDFDLSEPLLSGRGNFGRVWLKL